MELLWCKRTEVPRVFRDPLTGWHTLASVDPASAAGTRTASRYRTARGLSVAVAGLFAGHWLVYRILAPNALQRALLLAETGHAYLPPAVTAGTGLAVVAATATFALGFRRGLCRDRATHRYAPHRHTLVTAIVLPALTQAVAFCLLEAVERVLAGAPLSGLLGPLLPVGVVLQLAVGALGGLLLFGLDRAGETAGHFLAGRDPVLRRPGATVPVLTVPSRPPRPCLAGSSGIRGPPAAAGT